MPSKRPDIFPEFEVRHGSPEQARAARARLDVMQLRLQAHIRLRKTPTHGPLRSPHPGLCGHVPRCTTSPLPERAAAAPDPNTAPSALPALPPFPLPQKPQRVFLPKPLPGDPEMPDEEAEESAKRTTPGDPDPEQKPGASRMPCCTASCSGRGRSLQGRRRGSAPCVRSQGGATARGSQCQHPAGATACASSLRRRAVPTAWLPKAVG
jgi:hypothetical protein